MTEQLGFYYSGLAEAHLDHEHTLYVDLVPNGHVLLGARGIAARDPRYEAEMTAQDLIKFGQMCQDLGRRMEAAKRRGQQR